MKPFYLERYFNKYENNIPFVMCASDCEPFHLNELLAMASPEMMRLYNSLRLCYGAPQGSEALRKEIIKTHFNKLGGEDVMDCVPEEGIYLAMRCLVEKGDHVVVTFPGYQSLYQIAKDCGAEVSRWQPQESADGVLRFDVADLKCLLRPDTRLVVINFPHNPTGCTISVQQQHDIVTLCRERGAHLFSDEMYRFLETSQSECLPAAADLYEKAISLGGLSKSFALPGLRLGWLATRDVSLMEKMAVYKDYTTICHVEVSDVLATIALQNSQPIIERNCNIVASNVNLFSDFCTKNPGIFRFHPPQATSVAFVELLAPMAVDKFCHTLAESHGVLLLPARVYESEAKRVRFGFGRTDFPQGLAKLEVALKSMGLIG